MKPRGMKLLAMALLVPGPWRLAADDALVLTGVRNAGGLNLSWLGTSTNTNYSVVRPYFEVQRSSDLRLWQPIGERLHTTGLAADPSLGVTLVFDQPNLFYRLMAVQPAKNLAPGTNGAQIFGYGDAFTNSLQRIGQISPTQFQALFPSRATYLPALTWDSIAAPFWDKFNLDPAVVNAGKQPEDPDYRSFDGRLNPTELALFQKNGFVVSE